MSLISTLACQPQRLSYQVIPKPDTTLQKLIYQRSHGGHKFSFFGPKQNSDRAG
jgi:hypothetical protein